ncbi:MAG: hypothetical protein KBD01_12490 [Acidobacteria bacterium]|nr:hypothetical protein [Acidobacteriota bacterium]
MSTRPADRAPRRGHEPAGNRTLGPIAGAVLLGLAILGAMGASALTLTYMQRRVAGTSRIDALTAIEPLSPGPVLQVDPPAELAELRAAADARLHSYGWADRERGLAHVPIERAMELVAAGVRPAPAGAGEAGGEPR